ncbi:hypothetical protein DEJ45_07315 [Streptomyces venezuelae]|uniref:hypothetical protein n=1 Tax=Streptomyces venezuelae TaxID=54571 RepID=UPI00123DDF49|nr:hypothetical protein [Streptomyces venezuelae]QES12224.1 hypothetical protein DEJ45_07315 [Streptomyces venezuelae]
MSRRGDGTEARRQAEETRQRRRRASLKDEHGTTAKDQTPGPGREEQRGEYPPRENDEEPT